MDGENDTTGRLLYEETVRGLSNDLSILDSIRARAGTLFGAALVATSFLSAKPGELLSLGGYGIAAISLFAAAALVTALMLMPRTLRFALDELDVGTSVPADSSPYRVFTSELRGLQMQNERPIGYMFWGMKILPLIVASELLCWVNEFSNLDPLVEVGMLVILNLVGVVFILWGRLLAI